MFGLDLLVKHPINDSFYRFWCAKYDKGIVLGGDIKLFVEVLYASIIYGIFDLFIMGEFVCFSHSSVFLVINIWLQLLLFSLLIMIPVNVNLLFISKSLLGMTLD